MVHYYFVAFPPSERDFRRFDYGVVGNTAAYGLADAPRYNLSSTTFPVSIYYGRNDYLVNFEVSIIQ